MSVNEIYYDGVSLKEHIRAKDIIIFPVDKGSATVVLIIGDYHGKIQRMLGPSVYMKTPPRGPNNVCGEENWPDIESLNAGTGHSEVSLEE